MTDTSNTDTHRETSTGPKGRLRYVARAILKVASGIYGIYKVVSKGYDIARTAWSLLKNWLD
jgi:hypothetical protein